MLEDRLDITDFIQKTRPDKLAFKNLHILEYQAAATGLPEIRPVNDLAQDLELELQGGGHATDWGRDNDSNPPSVRVFSPDEPFFFTEQTRTEETRILGRHLNFVLN